MSCCYRCGRPPERLAEYIDMAEEEGITPEQAVRLYEGTFNAVDETFCCTPCYIAIGMPTVVGGDRWIAPPRICRFGVEVGR